MNKKFYHPNYESSKLSESISEILDSSPLWSMATLNDAKSYINTAYFCYDSNFFFYFLTPPSSQHSLNILKNDSMAVTIFDTNQPWGENPLRGMQIFGTARITDSSNEEIAYNTYGKRFPGFFSWMNTLSKEEKDNVQSKFYCFMPTNLKLFDEKTFGAEVFIPINL
jgi:uncharacterized protein YhbP (UPF0306 family)